MTQQRALHYPLALFCTFFGGENSVFLQNNSGALNTTRYVAKETTALWNSFRSSYLGRIL